MRSPQEQVMCIASIYGRCRSTPSPSPYTSLKLVAFSLNSSMVPITSTPLHCEHFQIGNGVAQYLFLEIFQSGADSALFLNLPCLICSGIQLIVSFLASNACFVL